MEDWTKIIANDDANEGDDIHLPPTEILNIDGNHQTEISYSWSDENDKTSIIRTERKVEIIEKKKKISKAAINRKQHWRKFGAVKSVSRGILEKGISTHRIEDVPFLWKGMSLEQIQKEKELRTRQLLEKQKLEKQQKEQQKQQQQATEKEENKENGDKPKQGQRYRPPTSLSLDDIFEIRISNLPDWTQWANIKELIDAFYRNYLNVRYPPKYKIRMFTTRHEGEKNAIGMFFLSCFIL